MCHAVLVEVSGQLLGIGLLLPPWVLGIKLRSPGLCAGRCLYLLSHFGGFTLVLEADSHTEQRAHWLVSSGELPLTAMLALQVCAAGSSF